MPGAAAATALGLAPPIAVTRRDFAPEVPIGKGRPARNEELEHA